MNKKTPFKISVFVLLHQFQESPDLNVCEIVSSLINATKDETTEVAFHINKWIRAEIYGPNLRHHHAAAILNKPNPVDMLRHVGNMIHKGYLKYVDPEISNVLERHSSYSDRYLMFCFLEWVKKTHPMSKVGIFLPEREGRIGQKDKYENGVVHSVIFGNAKPDRKKKTSSQNT